MKILQEADEGTQQSSLFIEITSLISIALLLMFEISVKLKWNELLKS
jgi:hypothetical protein